MGDFGKGKLGQGRPLFICLGKVRGGLGWSRVAHKEEIVVVRGRQCLLLVVKRSTSRVGEEIIVVEVAGMFMGWFWGLIFELF
ncbi:hypothetical protein NC652_036790 [Populus alba x Populus x berolinensis]|nr:hypothetical protein NC652_036790 [Populus alba x Populus x berolinensis]